MKRFALGLLLGIAGASPAARADSDETARQLVESALKDDWGYRFLEGLTTEIGPRLAGTEAETRAAGWAQEQLKAAGLQNVKAETFPMPGWVRGAETARVVWPAPQNLAVTTLGDSVPTSNDGIEAEVALYRSWAEFMAAPPGALQGKIAVVTQHMTRTMDASGYSALYKMRGTGPSEAARRGAVAYLLRSLGTDSARRPHTGSVDYVEGLPKIPAGALSNPDADQLERLAAKGTTVRLRLVLTPKPGKEVQSTTVSAEIPGSEHPEQIVLIGAHLDSWDLGTGAIDDGAGDAIVSGAARLIAALPQRPRRTIRVVLFGAEERDFSGKAYAQAHREEVPHIMIASEADSGARTAYAIRLPKGYQAGAFADRLASVLAPIRVFADPVAADDGGADFEELGKLGLPFVQVHQNDLDYFDYHHTADDTFDKVDQAELAQATAAWAAWVWLAADSDADFRSPANP